MTELLTFILLGLGAGAAYAAVSLGLVVTFKGTGVINFAGGAIGAWGCYVYSELRSTGRLVLPLPVGGSTAPGGEGPYGGPGAVVLTAVSGALLWMLLLRVSSAVGRRYPGSMRLGRWVSGLGAAAWGVVVFEQLSSTGRFWLPLPPEALELGPMGFGGALVVACLAAGSLGLLVHLFPFRLLHSAPPLAKVVASVGLLTTVQSLIVLRFGSSARTVPKVLPDDPIRIAGSVVPQDRLWVAGVAVAVSLAVSLYFRTTRLGLATRAAAESETGASLARYSPQALAALTWVITASSMTLILVLTLQIIPLNPTIHTLMVVPALACALLGRLSGIGRAVAGAFTLGALQSLLAFGTSKPWWPDWLRTGLSDAVPFIGVIAVLFVLGRSLPSRGTAHVIPLPPVSITKTRPSTAVAALTAAVLAIGLTDGSVRYGIVISLIFAIASLSIVLLTGLVGQISLAQAALAGVGGFTVAKVGAVARLDLPIALLIAGLVAATFGVLVGFPAVRIRGPQLGVVTLAAAVALERLVFRNPSFANGAGEAIPAPTILGVDLSLRQGTTVARWQFGIAVLVVLAIAAFAVANIARSGLGRTFLAVRSSERAAASAGVNVAAIKLVGFGLSAFIAGIAGALLAFSRGQLSAESFSVFVNVNLLASAYIGGITTIAGAVVGGALAPLGIAYVISDRLFDVGGQYTLVAGLALMGTAVANPVGIAGATAAQWQRFTRIRQEPDILEAPEGSHQTAPIGHQDQTRQRADGPRPDELVLESRGLTVHYGGVAAVDNVDIEVRAGEIVGLIGPNGAGKTSLVDALTGFTPAKGTVRLSGRPIDRTPAHTRARLGLRRTWQSGETFTELSVQDNLRVASESATIRSVVADIVGRRRDRNDNIDWALTLAGLDAVRTDAVRSLSLGDRKLLGFARAIAAKPTVVLLDEPAAGLGLSARQHLVHRLDVLVASDISVLIIDHDTDLIFRSCDYVYVLHFGRIIAAGRPEEVRNDPAVISAYLGSPTVPVGSR